LEQEYDYLNLVTTVTGYQGIDLNSKNLGCMHSRRAIHEKDRLIEQRQC
jgi:hypothetical protein